MAFQQGLSGLNAASRGLDVIGHNIANANTTGMKAGRAEFSEIFAASSSLPFRTTFSTEWVMASMKVLAPAWFAENLTLVVDPKVDSPLVKSR